MANQILAIAPYWLDSVETWVFDDQVVELVQEPFVSGVPEMIEELVTHVPDARQGFRLLFKACHGHTYERTHPDVTIQTCWDSDRLDLGRVGVTPHPSRLCTAAAKRPEMIQWADGRASFGVVQTFVLDDCGIDMEMERRW